MVRAVLAVLAGHLAASLVGGSVLAGVMLRDPFWQGLSALERLGLAAGLSVSVMALAAPGWLVLRLLVIRPLLRRGWRGGAALLLFAGCEGVNAVAALLGMVTWNGGRVAGDAQGTALGLLLFFGAGVAAGAAAWAGERLVGGPQGRGRAVA